MTFVVTGCGHSGTQWVSRALSRAGIACGHEDRYTLHGERGPTNGQSGDSAWPAAACLDRLAPEVRVAHLVRNPFQVVASIYGEGWLDEGASLARRYVEELLPSVFDAPPGVERACRYWVEWNLLVETHVAQPRLVRIEDISTDPAAFARLAAFLTGDPPIDEDLAGHAIEVDSAIGHKPRRPDRQTMTLDHSAEWAGHLLTLGARYGYRTR